MALTNAIFQLKHMFSYKFFEYKILHENQSAYIVAKKLDNVAIYECEQMFETKSKKSRKKRKI